MVSLETIKEFVDDNLGNLFDVTLYKSLVTMKLKANKKVQLSISIGDKPPVIRVAWIFCLEWVHASRFHDLESFKAYALEEAEICKDKT